MPATPRKYVVDTNLFIDGFRDEAANLDLQRFHAAFAPFVHLHSVVAHELCAGTRSVADRDKLERELLEKFERLDRVVTPSAACWDTCGNVLADIARADGIAVSKVSKSFLCDILIAQSCREAGATLITANTADFQRIARYVTFKYVPPWPV
jgi:predicted nucleic acid-binding protein